MNERVDGDILGRYEISLALPEWVARTVAEGRGGFTELATRMRFVIGLARRNVAEGTGGPFGAAVFRRDTWELVAPGVNVVVGQRCSVAHAEIVALMLAGQSLGTHDLGAAVPAGVELVTSTEPCAMCMGAIPWAGVASLVCGARGEDATAIGLDEGAKPPHWPEDLAARGIRVTRDVLRDEAAAVLRAYAAAGGPIYNGTLSP